MPVHPESPALLAPLARCPGSASHYPAHRLRTQMLSSPRSPAAPGPLHRRYAARRSRPAVPSPSRAWPPRPVDEDRRDPPAELELRRQRLAAARSIAPSTSIASNGPCSGTPSASGPACTTALSTPCAAEQRLRLRRHRRVGLERHHRLGHARQHRRRVAEAAADDRARGRSARRSARRAAWRRPAGRAAPAPAPAARARRDRRPAAAPAAGSPRAAPPASPR